MLEESILLDSFAQLLNQPINSLRQVTTSSASITKSLGIQNWFSFHQRTSLVGQLVDLIILLSQ